MVEIKTEPTLRGDLHHVESDEFDFMIALYERALEAGHETDCGKIREGLYWVEVCCSAEEFNTIFQQARAEAHTTWQRQPMKLADSKADSSGEAETASQALVDSIKSREL